MLAKLSLRRIHDVVIRRESVDIALGRYKVHCIFWFWAEREHPPSSSGSRLEFRPGANPENPIYQHRFPLAAPDCYYVGTILRIVSLLPVPSSSKRRTGQQRTGFRDIGIDRRAHICAPKFLLRRGYKEQTLDDGLWGSFKHTGRAVASDIVVDVHRDGCLVFVISRDWPHKPGEGPQ